MSGGTGTGTGTSRRQRYERGRRDAQHAEAVLLVVEGHPLDGAGEHFESGRWRFPLRAGVSRERVPAACGRDRVLTFRPHNQRVALYPTPVPHTGIAAGAEGMREAATADRSELVTKADLAAVRIEMRIYGITVLAIAGKLFGIFNAVAGVLA